MKYGRHDERGQERFLRAMSSRKKVVSGRENPSRPHRFGPINDLTRILLPGHITGNSGYRYPRQLLAHRITLVEFHLMNTLKFCPGPSSRRSFLQAGAVGL